MREGPSAHELWQLLREERLQSHEGDRRVAQLHSQSEGRCTEESVIFGTSRKVLGYPAQQVTRKPQGCASLWHWAPYRGQAGTPAWAALTRARLWRGRDHCQTQDCDWRRKKLGRVLIGSRLSHPTPRGLLALARHWSEPRTSPPGWASLLHRGWRAGNA